MNETAKCQASRVARGHFRRYLRGFGLQIAPDDERLQVYEGSVRVWASEDGDAQFLAAIPDAAYDFVYASHSLEHQWTVSTTLRNWARVLKPGGHLYLVVPDYALYEKLHWPSPFNPGHRHSFSLEITREQVNRQNHFHVAEDLAPLLEGCGLIVVETELEDQGFDYDRGLEDQTPGPALAQILIVARKRDKSIDDPW